MVVVQTYPAHFYQTLGCLLSLRRLSGDQPIWLIVDDLSNFSWPQYSDLCRRTYSGLVDHMICCSDVPGLYRLKSWPWLRQQTNKLMLDKILPDSAWLFLDGDVHVSRLPLDYQQTASITAYAGRPLDQGDPRPGEMSSQVIFYVRHMLGIEFDGFWTADGQAITSSHPPVKHMRSDLLSGLRDYVERRFGRPLIDVQLALAADTRMAACEWDLIEAYRQLVLGEPACWYFDNDFFQTTWSSDRELGTQWFECRNITIDPEIWSVLPESKNNL